MACPKGTTQKTIKRRKLCLRDEATAGSSRRRNANLKKGKQYRFTKADAKGCNQSDRKARGKCIAKHMQARVG